MAMAANSTLVSSDYLEAALAFFKPVRNTSLTIRLQYYLYHDHLTS